MPDSRPSHLAEMLAAHGITETRGVEIMRLVRMLANAYEMIVSARMREDGLSGPRWRLLLHLFVAAQMGKGALSPTQLSKTQNVSKNTISSLLRSLEEQGWIERTLDANDRRQFHIRISAAGQELIRASTPGHMDFLNQLLADFSPAEIDQLLDLLARLHAALVARGGLSHTYEIERA